MHKDRSYLAACDAWCLDIENLKRKRQLKPSRRKRMKREARLQSAKHWISKYQGNNLVRGYAKWYGVDFICAINELRMLGAHVDEDYERKVRQLIEAKAEQRQRHRFTRKEKELEELYPDSDDTFAYIAGYTPAGFPYGVTWEELGEEPPWIDDDDIEKSR